MIKLPASLSEFSSPAEQAVLETLRSWLEPYPDISFISLRAFIKNNPDVNLTDLVLTLVDLVNARVLQRMYGVVDTDGDLMPCFYKSLEDIPTTAPNSWGEMLETEKLEVVPIYMPVEA